MNVQVYFSLFFRNFFIKFQPNERIMAEELYKIDCLVSETIKKDIEPAHNYTKNHITNLGEILGLDVHCEYCKVYFEEQRLLTV